MTGSTSDSLERIVPDDLEEHQATGRETLRLHLERYRFAATAGIHGCVLDLACGVGYGSALLAEAGKVRRVIAADLSAVALSHGRQRYSGPKISFVRGDGAGWARSNRFDAVVSLETLEHVPDPEALFAEFGRALRPSGLLIASVPITPSVDGNPHHLTDFTERTFLAMGARAGLAVVDTLRQEQPYSLRAVALRTERRTQDLRRGLLGYYLRHPAALYRRIASIVADGFTNKYLTVAWQRR